MKGEEFSDNTYISLHTTITSYANKLYRETNLVRREYLKAQLEGAKTELDRYIQAFKRTRDDKSRRSAGYYTAFRHKVKFKRY